MEFPRNEARGLARSFLQAAIWRVAFRSPWPVMVILVLVAIAVLVFFPEAK